MGVFQRMFSWSRAPSGTSGSGVVLGLGYTRRGIRWGRPLPSNAPEGTLEGIAEAVRPIWELLCSGDTSASYARWMYGGQWMEPLAPDDDDLEIRLTGQGPKFLEDRAMDGLRRARANHSGADVGWHHIGPVFSRAVRVVLPPGAQVGETMPVWFKDRWSVLQCPIRTAEPWNGLRTVWVEVDPIQDAAVWSLGVSPFGTLDLDVELTLNLWLESDPPACHGEPMGVPLAIWRQHNQAFLAEVFARLDERWGKREG